MKRPIRRAMLWSACLVLLCALAAHAQARKERPPRPKLVVVLVVDQMRADYVERFRQQWTGGLRRLVERGAWFRQAAYPYLNTFTCVGHATVSTGSFPRGHGIVANAWFEGGKRTVCTDDAAASVVSYGPPGRGGYSAARLALPTLADELRAQADGKTRVVTMSVKARSAIMLAGHRGDAVVWFDAATGAFETSTAYAQAPVGFVEKFVKAQPVDQDFGRKWDYALPQGTYLYGEPKQGSSLPRVLRGRGNKPDTAFYDAWEASPFSDAYLGAMAQAAVDALSLGKGGGTDFLGVSFSALDLVGHAVGPRHPAVQDVLVRLDATLGALLDHLDRVVGAGNYVAVLTADHGVAPVPEQAAQEGYSAGRIAPKAVADAVEKALEPFLGPDKKVAWVSDNDLYFALGVYEKLVANPTAMQAAIAAILGVPGVGRMFRSDELREQPTINDPIRRAAALGYFAGRSGDLILVPRPYWFFSEESASVATTHGTAYGYDARVPIFFLGYGIRRGVYLTAATPADIAPTLAFLCGVTLARPDGRVLTEALEASAAAQPARASPSR